MKSFIEIHTIHPNNEELDTTFHLRADQIDGIQTPTIADHKMRKEIRSVVHVRGGGCYATSENPEQVLALMEAAEL